MGHRWGKGRAGVGQGQMYGVDMGQGWSRGGAGVEQGWGRDGTGMGQMWGRCGTGMKAGVGEVWDRCGTGVGQGWRWVCGVGRDVCVSVGGEGVGVCVGR